MWTQRDQFSNQQIPLQDQDIILRQNEEWMANHPHSEKSKAPVAKTHPADRIAVGDLVYLYSNRNKTRACDHYLVVEIDGAFCNIRKFVGSQLHSTSYRVKTSKCYRIPSEVADFRPSAFNNDADLSADEAPPAQPAPPTPPPPVIPSAILTPATQAVPGHADLTTSHNEPCDTKSHPDPGGSSATPMLLSRLEDPHERNTPQHIMTTLSGNLDK